MRAAQVRGGKGGSHLLAVGAEHYWGYLCHWPGGLEGPGAWRPPLRKRGTGGLHCIILHRKMSETQGSRGPGEWQASGYRCFNRWLEARTLCPCPGEQAQPGEGPGATDWHGAQKGAPARLGADTHSHRIDAGPRCREIIHVWLGNNVVLGQVHSTVR